MSGFRSAIKKGGGFLNNVDGVLKSYTFEDRFKGEKKAGKWIYFVPVIHTDGADEPVDQHLFVGGADRYTISEDGQELTHVDESPVTFGFSTPFGRFMDSLCEAGFPEDELPNLADGDALNLSAIVDRRFRFKQEVDVEATKKLGKRKVGTGKNAKEYDRTNTVIEAVLAASAGGKKAAKPAASKGKAKDEDDEDSLKEEAADVLKDVLEKATTPVTRKNMSLPVSKALMKNANKDALKAIILDEDWQDEQSWLSIDKKGALSVDE